MKTDNQPQTPLNIPDNGEIVVTMYRQTDDRKVWYEWIVEVFAFVPSNENTGAWGGITTMSNDNNPGQQQQQQRKGNSRRVRVGMSDLHSSIKDGCLM